jgi:hypothetical protein
MKRRIIWASCIGLLAVACGQNPNLTLPGAPDPVPAGPGPNAGPDARVSPVPGPSDEPSFPPDGPPGGPPPDGPKPEPTPDCSQPQPSGFSAHRISGDRFRSDVEIETFAGLSTIEFAWDTDENSIWMPLGTLVPECPKPEPKPTWAPKPQPKPTTGPKQGEKPVFPDQSGGER